MGTVVELLRAWTLEAATQVSDTTAHSSVTVGHLHPNSQLLHVHIESSGVTVVAHWDSGASGALRIVIAHVFQDSFED